LRPFGKSVLRAATDSDNVPVMSTLSQVLPTTQNSITPEVVADATRRALSLPLGVAEPEAVAFCADLSTQLMADTQARRFPALQALAFWLRPASIRTMIQNHMAAPAHTLRVPRGVVFQIPPSNVDVLFAYMAALSLLAGNVTIVRLPRGHRPEQELLLDILADCLADAPQMIRERLILIRYDHDIELTAAFSALCDARMVWGGDETVTTIRRVPLPPLAVEASFADRFSSMALDAKAYLLADDAQREHIVHAITNDIYLFDQMTCASPRLALWVGSADEAEKAREDFYPRLAAHAGERYGSPPAGENLAKLNAHFLALHDLPVTESKIYTPALTVLTLSGWEGLSAFKTINYGYGLLLDVRLETLAALARKVEKRDQTLTVWGFTPQETEGLVRLSGGDGFDRVVPVGQALSFDPVWDGHNLFDTLTRLIQVTV
jgi:hypothetical protein